MMTLKKGDNNHARAWHKKIGIVQVTIFYDTVPAPCFAACSPEWRINHVVIVLSFRAAIARARYTGQ